MKIVHNVNLQKTNTQVQASSKQDEIKGVAIKRRPEADGQWHTVDIRTRKAAREFIERVQGQNGKFTCQEYSPDCFRIEYCIPVEAGNQAGSANGGPAAQPKQDNKQVKELNTKIQSLKDASISKKLADIEKQATVKNDNGKIAQKGIKINADALKAANAQQLNVKASMLAQTNKNNSRLNNLM